MRCAKCGRSYNPVTRCDECRSKPPLAAPTCSESVMGNPMTETWRIEILRDFVEREIARCNNAVSATESHPRRHWRIWTDGALNILLQVQKLLPPNEKGHL